MRHKWYFIAGFVIILTILVALVVYMSNEKDVEGVIQANGQVRGTEITIRSKIPGRLDKVLINEGQQVYKGDLIAEISSEEIEAKIEQAKAQIEIYNKQKEVAYHNVHQAKATLARVESSIVEVQSQLNLARSDYRKFSELADKGIISRREMEATEAQYKSTQAKLNAAEDSKEEAIAAIERAEASQEVTANQLVSAEAKLKEIIAVYNDTKVNAPSSGTVINKLAEQGELVTEGTPIAVLIDLSDLYVRVYISEKEIGKIRLGNPARIYTDAFPDKYFEGAIAEVSQKAEFTPKEVHMKEERTKLVFGVKITIKNPEGFLKPGMPVDANIRWKQDAQW
ncbi:MAG: HlyD family efflux transporter periplasmic adaptor subunit [Candidatus Dadabacteria bacterium]|nr:HlyD family efflux transporter periplasmic adaptor subunit [Candidatus Dadabacteria bacterium]